MATFTERLSAAWDVFRGRESAKVSYGPGYYDRPDRPRLSMGNERSIVTAIYERISIDVAAIPVYHAKKDEDNNFVEVIKSDLNDCFTLSANLDQSGRAFFQDIVLSLFDKGVIAVVPTDTSKNPEFTDSYKIFKLRVGTIKEWYPQAVRVEVYNENDGRKHEVTVLKKNCAIVENPFYAVMNERNSIAKRLIYKLNLLDAIDEQSGAGKLDLIIQFPYPIRSEARKVQADARRKELEDQLNGSKYGVAWADGTEKIVQLNRGLENNLMSQIEYLTTMLYSQLGISEEILKGTADEQTILNYYNNTVEPVLSAITNEFRRKFLTKTAVSQNQTVMFIRDPFRLIPVNNIADIADKFTRNEILSSNEVRSIIGKRPVADERADELRNKNLNASNDQLPVSVNSDDVEDIENHYEDES